MSSRCCRALHIIRPLMFGTAVSNSANPPAISGNPQKTTTPTLFVILWKSHAPLANCEQTTTPKIFVTFTFCLSVNLIATISDSTLPAPIGVASYGALGHVPPSTYNNLIFSVHFDLYKVWQRLHVSHWLLHVPVLAPTPGDATAFCACHIVFLTWFSLSSSITPSFFHSRLKPTCFTNLSHHIHCFLPSLGLPPRTITRTVSYEQLDFFLLALFLTIYVFVTPCGVYPPAFRRT